VPLYRLDLLDEREVELIEAVELRLLDLHHVEEAAVAVGREPDAVLRLVELLLRAVERPDLHQPPARGQLAHRLVDGLLGRAQPVGQVLAVQLVYVAPPLARGVPAVPRNLLAQPLQPVTLIAHLGFSAVSFQFPVFSFQPEQSPFLKTEDWKLKTVLRFFSPQGSCAAILTRRRPRRIIVAWPARSILLYSEVIRTPPQQTDSRKSDARKSYEC
jgi:hypothetical protein